MAPLSRRTALALAGSALVGACAPPRERRSRSDGTSGDLAERVRTFTGGITRSMPYRPPTRLETDELVAALTTLLVAPDDPGARSALEDHGFSVGATDHGPGRPYVVAANGPADERSWGLFALPRGVAPRVIVEVPHPVADRDTEEVGLDLVAALPGAVLIEAGAHRRADDSRADVAHETSSLFHAVVDRVATDRGLPQIQLHGFDDAEHDPEVDVVLSPGATTVSTLVAAVGDRLGATGHRVCRVWSDDCPDLAGRTNVQGIAARAAGLPFVHVEMAPELRSTAAARRETARALGNAVRSI